MTVNIIPRNAGTNTWIFFVSPQRLPRALHLPGIEGAGLWLATPLHLTQTQSSPSTIEIAPFSLFSRSLPVFYWQVVEVNLSAHGMRVSIGSRNQVVDW